MTSASAPAATATPDDDGIRHYDAIVLGSGQSGTPLASAFAKAGRRTLLIERDHIGGTCINEGCTPTKTMIASGRVAYLTRRGPDYGVTVSMEGEEEKKPAHRVGSQDAEILENDVQVDMARVRQRKRDIVASFSGGSESRLRKAGVEILWGEARFVKHKTLVVRVNDGDEGTAASIRGGQEVTVKSELVFINTGERPAMPKLPGLESIDPARVLNSTTIMELGDVPHHLLVLGGGYIGLEFAQLFRRLGSRVSIVQQNNRLAPREDEVVSRAVLEIFKDDGVAVYPSSTISSITTKQEAPNMPIVATVVTAGEEKPLSVSASHILLATGRAPNTEKLNLAAAGVATGPRGHVLVDDHLATSAAGVYALGDVHGGPAFTHMSYDDFRIIQANLLPQPASAAAEKKPAFHTTSASLSRNMIPYVMYTDPQLAHVGKHEYELRQEKREFRTATMPMAYVARALETDETRGMMRAHVDATTGEILGFTCLGIEGGEVMAVVQTAMMGGVKWWDLEAAVWAHPSLAEGLNNLWGFFE